MIRELERRGYVLLHGDAPRSGAAEPRFGCNPRIAEEGERVLLHTSGRAGVILCDGTMLYRALTGVTRKKLRRVGAVKSTPLGPAVLTTRLARMPYRDVDVETVPELDRHALWETLDAAHEVAEVLILSRGDLLIADNHRTMIGALPGDTPAKRQILWERSLVNVRKMNLCNEISTVSPQRTIHVLQPGRLPTGGHQDDRADHAIHPQRAGASFEVRPT